MSVADSSSQSSQITFWCKWQNTTEVAGMLYIYTGQTLFQQHLLLFDFSDMRVLKRIVM